MDEPRLTERAGRRGVEVHGKDCSTLERRPEGDPMGDDVLAASVARGDRTALAALYDRHGTAAYSLAVRLVGVTSAQDVVHDAFVALLDRPSTFDPARGSFRAWFMTGVHRRCLTLIRGQSRLADDGALAALAAPDPEPSETIVQSLEDAAVREALRKLPSTQREALVLAYYQGLSQSALSKRLGVPLGTVKARMRRGLIALRGLLDGRDIEPEPDEEEPT